MKQSIENVHMYKKIGLMPLNHITTLIKTAGIWDLDSLDLTSNVS